MLKPRTLLIILIPGLILLLYLGRPVLTQLLTPPEEVTSLVEEVSNPLPIAPPTMQSPITIRPEIIGPGDEVTIVGGWPDQAEYRIYVANDSEKYLIGKAGFNGGMQWNGVVEKTMKTLDGEEVNLPQDKYRFVVETDSNHWEGGQINLVADSVPIPSGAEIRMTAAMQAQVGFDLLSLRLNKYKDKTIPVDLQLREYKINLNDINLISGEYSPLIFQIKYSVLPTLSNSDWNFIYPSPDGWVSPVVYVTVVADNGQFKIHRVSEYPPPQIQPNMFAPSVTPYFTNPGSIAIELMNVYFKHFTTDSIPNDQRLLSYKLNEIRIISQSAYGFVFYLNYSIQGTNEATSWCAGNGEIKANGLVENKVWFVRVTKEGTTYTMVGAGTSP